MGGLFGRGFKRVVWGVGGLRRVVGTGWWFGWFVGCWEVLEWSGVCLYGVDPRLWRLRRGCIEVCICAKGRKELAVYLSRGYR